MQLNVFLATFLIVDVLLGSTGVASAGSAHSATALSIPKLTNPKLSADSHPNILFILTDDQRHSAVGYAEREPVITPNLDDLSQRGVSFSNAHIMGAMSAAVCAPSRAMLMTGRNVFEVSAQGEFIDPSIATLPQVLKNNGYFTFHTGKWHNDKASFARSFSGAEHIFFGGMSDQYQIPLYDFDQKGNYSAAPSINPVKHSTDLYADAVIDFLENYDKAQPFFAYVAFQSPHDPKQVPSEYFQLYQPNEFDDTANLLPQHPFDNGELDVRDEWLSPLPRTQRDAKTHLAAYYAMITHIDARIGDMLNVLKARNMLDNTLIIFSSDNGLSLGQHGLLGKQSLYEHSLRVPLLIAGPNMPVGETRDELVYLSDMFPSLLDILNIDAPASVTQPSIYPLLNGSKQVESTVIHESPIFAYKNVQRAIKQDDYKLIEYNVKGSKHTQLFNVKSDPLERNNLASLPAHADRIKKMHASLQAQLTKAGDAAMLDTDDWSIPYIMQWGEQMQRPEKIETYHRLKKMAAEEHQMVMGYYGQDN
ncbi:sulfatase-like hydrolase/transferase [Ningiella sp. W23]|uniref:sulfatase-like hydrolase/transferase n=1 Tax=Ningiella sp. W23 TaxID=3023715 RepID=UPI0037582790